MTHRLIAIEPVRLFEGGPVVDVVIVDIPGLGTVAAVLPPIPEDAAPVVREGLARRRLTLTTGLCPCGAEAHLPSPRIEHEDDCPAVDKTLIAALKAS